MDNKSKEAFAVVVDDSWYQDFIPFFIYFTKRAYPTAETFVFVRSKLHSTVQSSLERLALNGMTGHIIEGFKAQYPTNSLTTKALRWTIGNLDVPKVEFLYIGDVDIAIAKEQVSLFDQHRDHADFLGMPFSNVIRPGAPRFSGLHFIKVKEYCQLVAEAQKELDKMLKNGVESSIKNETLLYNMLEQSKLLTRKLFWLGGDIGSKRVQYRPFHGVHLGVFRSHKKYLFVDEDDIKYFQDLLLVFQENSILNYIMKQSCDRIRTLFSRALSFGNVLCQT